MRDNTEEEIYDINFESADQKFRHSIKCKKTDIFSKLEDNLYNEYPQLKNKNISFIANGKEINKGVTLEQNNINNGNRIIIVESEKKKSSDDACCLVI